MRAHAAAFLSDIAAKPDSPEACIAHRAVGITHWFAGEYREARAHLERSLALFEPGRDDDLAFRFGHDAGVGAMLYLAIALWPLGDVARAVTLVKLALRANNGVPHINDHRLRENARGYVRTDARRPFANCVECRRAFAHRQRSRPQTLARARLFISRAGLKFGGGAHGDGRAAIRPLPWNSCTNKTR